MKTKINKPDSIPSLFYGCEENTIQPTTKELVAWAFENDAQHTSRHEAAHVVAALQTGVPVVAARIFPTFGELYNFNSVVGDAIAYGKKSAEQSAIIGFAGLAAEMLYRDNNVEAKEFLDHIKLYPEHLSLTDWRLVERISVRRRSSASKKCFNILTVNWDKVELVARLLREQLYKNPKRGKARQGYLNFVGVEVPRLT